MKHIVAVLTEPTEGREDEFNNYYENLHLDEVLATTGWHSAQRFELVDQAGAECPLPYLAVYEVDTEDSAEILKTLNETRPQRQQSDALNFRTGRAWVAFWGGASTPPRAIPWGRARRSSAGWIGPSPASTRARRRLLPRR